MTPQTVRGAVEVETTGTGRTRWTAGLAETRVETTETGRWPGGDHSVNRARRSSQELVEPGGDHRRGTTRSGSPAHRTGGGYSGCRAR